MFATFRKRASALIARLGRDRVMAVAGLAISVAILWAVLRELKGVDLTMLLRAPISPLFWLCFLGVYVLTPVMDWLILRRIWGVGIDALPALLRKQVANEVVFGYSGDAQLYVWARGRVAPGVPVFETLRDVAVTSALAGNIATLVMVGVTAPILYALAAGTLLNTLLASTAVVVISSLAIFAFRRMVFALPRRALLETFGIHCVRTAVSLLLTAMLWKLLLPEISAGTLVVVATVRMMIYRLPLIPARDTLLAPLIAALIGTGSGLAGAVLFVAALTLATHVLVGGVASLADLLPRRALPRRLKLRPATTLA